MANSPAEPRDSEPSGSKPSDGEPVQARRARRSSGPLKGAVTAPGDKSISHRAVILGALADGETTIRGLLEGDDVMRTAAAMRECGAQIDREKTAEGAIWRVRGGEWRSPKRTLYFGNSGTGCRLTMGAVAGRRIAVKFDGDGSLRNRPMNRILDPLALMGANVANEKDGLPCEIQSGKLKAIDYELPTPSAQIKSAILLAGLGAAGETVVREPIACRDHTERMFSAFGAKIDIETGDAGDRIIRLRGGQKLAPANLDVPGDPSSAAFLVVAALIVEGSDVTVCNVLVNPLRAGLFHTLKEMGGDIVFENNRIIGGEPVADIRARYSPLNGVRVPGSCAASMIDEYPILSIAAAFAAGETKMSGLGELRVKECDRIDAIAEGLTACGVAVESGPDWLTVEGTAGEVAGGAAVATHRDHRIAMSFLVMGLGAGNPVEIDDASMIATSFPGFDQTLQALRR